MNAMLFVRVLHVAATCTSLGGLVYARAVMLPAASRLPPGERDLVLSASILRFAWIKWIGVAVVAITGIIQMSATLATIAGDARMTYLACFALKMLGAIGLFTITFLLAMPAGALRRMQTRRALWSTVNIACALVILVGAAAMRAAH